MGVNSTCTAKPLLWKRLPLASGAQYVNNGFKYPPGQDWFSAAASQEQSQGVGQINRAVAEMDKIIQMNSANAEKSSASSFELNSRAEELQIFIRELSALVGGNLEEGGNAKTRARSVARGLFDSLAVRMNKVRAANGSQDEISPDREPQSFEEPREQKSSGALAKYLHSF
jgi:hypothetical protein